MLIESVSHEKISLISQSSKMLKGVKLIHSGAYDARKALASHRSWKTPLETHGAAGAIPVALLPTAESNPGPAKLRIRRRR